MIWVLLGSPMPGLRVRARVSVRSWRLGDDGGGVKLSELAYLSEMYLMKEHEEDVVFVLMASLLPKRSSSQEAQREELRSDFSMAMGS